MNHHLLLINGVLYGSTGRLARASGEFAVQNGWKATLAHGRDVAKASPSQKLGDYVIGSQWSLYAHVLRTRLLDQHGFGSRRATMKFLDQVDQWQPTVLHLHNLHGYYLNIELLFEYIKATGIPTVWTLHDCWAFTGHCSHFEYIGCEKWKTGCGSCPNKKKYPASILLDASEDNYRQKRTLFTGVDNMTIITPSQWLANLARESFLGEYPIEVIQNGIDLDVFYPEVSDVRAQLGISPQDFMVLGVALNFSDPLKGGAHFIELAQANPNIKVVLLGMTPSQQGNLPENIIPLERTESLEKLRQLYTAADVFFNPTLEDTFPAVNLEALACETPVITFHTGGCPEQVTPECGFCVPQQDMDAVNDAILAIQGGAINPSLCRKRALENYSLATYCTKTFDLYNKVRINAPVL